MVAARCLKAVPQDQNKRAEESTKEPDSLFKNKKKISSSLFSDSSVG